MRIKLRTIVIDCYDAQITSTFYCKLLGWEKTVEEPDWVLVRDPDGCTGLSFQTEADYIPPVWPEEKNKQQKMLHIDFLVDDLEQAVSHAIGCGATKSPNQYLNNVVVMLDPDSHPFCFFTDPNYVW